MNNSSNGTHIFLKFVSFFRKGKKNEFHVNKIQLTAVVAILNVRNDKC